MFIVIECIDFKRAIDICTRLIDILAKNNKICQLIYPTYDCKEQALSKYKDSVVEDELTQLAISEDYFSFVHTIWGLLNKCPLICINYYSFNGTRLRRTNKGPIPDFVFYMDDDKVVYQKSMERICKPIGIKCVKIPDNTELDVHVIYSVIAQQLQDYIDSRTPPPPLNKPSTKRSPPVQKDDISIL